MTNSSSLLESPGLAVVQTEELTLQEVEHFKIERSSFRYYSESFYGNYRRQLEGNMGIIVSHGLPTDQSTHEALFLDARDNLSGEYSWRLGQERGETVSLWEIEVTQTDEGVVGFHKAFDEQKLLEERKLSAKEVSTVINHIYGLLNSEEVTKGLGSESRATRLSHDELSDLLSRILQTEFANLALRLGEYSLN